MNQIHSFLRNWSHLLKKSLMENFTFCQCISVYLLDVIRKYWLKPKLFSLICSNFTTINMTKAHSELCQVF